MNPSKRILCWLFIKEKERCIFGGEVVKEEDKEGDLEVKFLRKHTKVPNDFVKPDVKGIESVPV